MNELSAHPTIQGQDEQHRRNDSLGVSLCCAPVQNKYHSVQIRQPWRGGKKSLPLPTLGFLTGVQETKNSTTREKHRNVFDMSFM